MCCVGAHAFMVVLCARTGMSTRTQFVRVGIPTTYFRACSEPGVRVLLSVAVDGGDMRRVGP